MMYANIKKTLGELMLSFQIRWNMFIEIPWISAIVEKFFFSFLLLSNDQSNIPRVELHTKDGFKPNI